MMILPTDDNYEHDNRFRSGQWRGYWHQPPHVGHMQLNLDFKRGQVSGTGSDFVGDFVIKGSYELESGKVFMNKFYIGQHEVIYTGLAIAGQYIAGQWKIRFNNDCGAFKIWPYELNESCQCRLCAESPIRKIIPLSKPFGTFFPDSSVEPKNRLVFNYGNAQLKG